MMNISAALSTCDVIDLDSSSNSIDGQQIALSSNSSHSSNKSRFTESFSTETITSNLKFNKSEWTVVDIKNKKSNCWKCLGIPVQKHNDKNELFDKFVSCKYCYMTYSFSSSTRNMNKHMETCDGFKPDQTRLIISPSPEINPPNVMKIFTSSNLSSSNSKNIELNKQKMKNLLVEWVCSNIRPINIVEDSGLKRLIEEAVKIGYICDPARPETIVSTRKTASKEIKTSALIKREQIKEVLVQAARERSLALSPDIWPDAYRQQSYLGRTAHWVDDTRNLYSLEIFCIPFNTPNKRAPNVLKVLREGLSIYNLIPFMRDIVWVTDRGSNIVKVLEEYEVVFCAAHRVNNILQELFFQEEGKRKKKNKKDPPTFDEIQYEDEEKMSDSESEHSAEESEDFDENGMSLQQRSSTNQKQQLHHQKVTDTSSYVMVTNVNHLTIKKIRYST